MFPKCFAQLYAANAPECQVCPHSMACCEASKVAALEMGDASKINGGDPHLSPTQVCVEGALKRGEFTCRELVVVVQQEVGSKGTAVPDVLGKLKREGKVDVRVEGNIHHYRWRC